MTASSQRSAPILWTPFDVLVLTKLTPPKPPPGCIARTRVHALLDQALAGRVTLVQAPAGYGKTTLLAQWSAQRAEHVAWVSLDQHEYDRPESFLAYLLTAIQRVHNDLGLHARKELFERGSAGVDTATRLLLNELAFFPEPIIIIIDDYHAAASESVDALTLQLCERLPEHVHLIVSTRSEPTLHVSRLQVAGQLVLISAAELAFDAAEVELFVRASFPQGFDRAQADAVAERAQGWAAGLRMAAIALADAPPERLAALPARMPLELRLLEDFLVDEVLGAQLPETLDFLLRVSILERVSPALAEAVSARSDAGRLLERLARAQLFVARLDDGHWFRLHQLLLDVLRRQAQDRLGLVTITELHQRAAHWFLAHEHTGDAIAHSIAAGAWEQAAALIKPALDTLIRMDRPWDLHSWIERLPPELLEHDVELALGNAWALNRLGIYGPLPTLLSAVERSLSEQPDPVVAARVATIQAGIARGRGDGEQMLLHAQSAYELAQGAPRDGESLAPPEDGDASAAWSPTHRQLALRTALIQHGCGLLRVGRPEQARRELEAVLLDASPLPGPRVLTPLVEIALAQLVQGKLQDARRTLDDIRAEVGERHEIVDYRFMLIVEADLLREWNRLAEADALLDEAEALSRNGHFRTFLPELNVVRARIDLAAGNAAQASVNLERALTAAHDLGSEQHANNVRAFQARLAIMSGDLAAARDWAFRSRLTADSEITPANLISLFTFARVLITDEEHDDAIRLLEQLRHDAEQHGRGHDVIEALVLQALAYQDLLVLDRAAQALDAALQLSGPEHFTRLFLDEGRALTRLLRAALHRDLQPREVRRLLAAAGVDVSGVSIRHPELAEPLTPREIEVLRMIAIGLTNREISEELFISVATVKRHITNIYGKLSCTSRTLVIERARALDLL